MYCMYNTVNVLHILCEAIQYLQYFIWQYFNLTWDSPLKLDLATSSMKIVQNTGLGICSFAFSLFALLFKIAQFKEQLWAICLLSTLFKKERLWANRSLKRVAVSELLSSLFTKERWWANHSRFLFKSATSVILSSFRVIRSKKTYLFACFWKFFTAFPRANQSFALSLTKKQMIRSKKVFNINIFLFMYSCYSQGPLHRSWDFYFMYNILQDAGIWTRVATHIPSMSYTHPYCVPVLYILQCIV